MRRLVVWSVLAVAALALTGCARAAAPRDQAAVAVRVEKVRAHLLAAAGNAAAGRWDLAVVHVGTPMQARNESGEEVLFFAYGAPPVTGKAEFLDDVESV